MEKQNLLQQFKLKKLQYFFQKIFYDIIDPIW